MASRRFKGKLSVYCSSRASTTGDHVCVRQFFIKSERQNLPQVLACEPCNNEKSELEHYLITMLPFGGRHEQAGETLATLVLWHLNGSRRSANSRRGRDRRHLHANASIRRDDRRHR